MAAAAPGLCMRTFVQSAPRISRVSLRFTNHRRAHTKSAPPDGSSNKPSSPSKPLVYAKNPTATSSASSSASPKRPPQTTVAYPYLRISLGIVLCGSIIYSMVRGYRSPISSPQLSLLPGCFQVNILLTDNRPHRAHRSPVRRRARQPQKARVRCNLLFAHEIAYGIINQDSTITYCLRT